ncbi:MAG: hypothetical protein JW779_04555 [Candidatus Thorarchaeota archaeon]|nr:hypothetical protein [Candidatus Thorarchaeota archaeon]
MSFLRSSSGKTGGLQLQDYRSSPTFYWALTGIFAALHLVMTMLPLFMLTSGEGFISIGLVTAVMIGFLLGPFYGTVSVTIGSGLGVILFNIGGILGPIVPVIAPAAGALVAGCLRTKRPQVVLIVYGTTFFAFLIGPIGLAALSYIWLHVIAMIMVGLYIIPQTGIWLRESMKLSESKPENTFFSLWILCFISLLADSLVGGTTAAYYFVFALSFPIDALAGIYNGAAFVYPLERIAVTFVITAVLLALDKALRKTPFESLLDQSQVYDSMDISHGDEAS